MLTPMVLIMRSHKMFTIGTRHTQRIESYIDKDELGIRSKMQPKLQYEERIRLNRP